MGVKENVMIVGGVTAVIGIGKALTRGQPVTIWWWLILLGAVIAFIIWFVLTDSVPPPPKPTDVEKPDQ